MDVISPDAATWTARPEWRLPRQTGDLRADWASVMSAHRASTEPWQERACLLRIQQLAERQQVRADAALAQWRALGEQLGRAVAQIGENLRRAMGVPEPLATGKYQQDYALFAPPARAGHVGPPQRRRPPRTIGRPSTTPRR